MFVVNSLVATAAPGLEQLNTNVRQSKSQTLQYTKEQYTKLDSSAQKDIASIWGLSTDEYLRYLRLMHNSSSGKWYQELNPGEVLGINAQDAQERMHFAKVVVRNAHKRVGKELEFQHAYDAAQKLLYPNEQPIMLPNMQKQNAAATLQAGDILLLFTNVHNSYTPHLIHRLSNILVAHAAVKLNIYITGKNISDSAIRNWAINNHVSAKMVGKNIITLNHDRGRLKKLMHGAKRQLPLVVLDRNGEFKPIQISSIW